jgi:ADP-glucose pyrophosphorylase
MLNDMHIAAVIREFVKDGTYTSFLGYYTTLVEAKVPVEFGVDDNDEFDNLHREEFYKQDIEEVRHFFEFNADKFKPEKIVKIYKKHGKDWYGWTSSPELPMIFPDTMCELLDKKDAEIKELQEKLLKALDKVLKN